MLLEHNCNSTLHSPMYSVQIRMDHTDSAQTYTDLHRLCMELHRLHTDVQPPKMSDCARFQGGAGKRKAQLVIES